MKIKFTPTNLYAVMVMAILGFASSSNTSQGGSKKEDGKQTIVGGEVAPIGRYTYTVALAYDGYPFCGGSLIAPDVVLTAAFCMDGEPFDVYINRHDRLSNSQGESIRRTKETIHPNWNPDTFENNFAVVILENRTTQNVDFITLNRDEDYPVAGATSRALGWGATSEGGNLSNKLRWVDLSIISNQVCDDKYPPIFPSQMCTLEPGKDACQGDSGGPLIIPGSVVKLTGF